MFKKMTADQAQDILFNSANNNKNKMFFENVSTQELEKPTEKKETKTPTKAPAKKLEKDSFKSTLNKFPFNEEDKSVILEIIKDQTITVEDKIEETFNFLDAVYDEETFNRKAKKSLKASMVSYLEAPGDPNEDPNAPPTPDAPPAAETTAPMTAETPSTNEAPTDEMPTDEAPMDDTEGTEEESSEDEETSIEDIDLSTLSNTEKLTVVQNIIDSIDDEDEFGEFMDSLVNLVDEYKDGGDMESMQDNSDDEEDEEDNMDDNDEEDMGGEEEDTEEEQ